MIGATIGPYRVVRELGQGGMGTVVLAEDTRLGRHVALKTVSGAQAGTTGGRAQLLDEARAAAAISHPAIAAVHDVVEHDGDIAIVFEFVEGETLAARLAKGALPEDQAIRIAVQMAEALSVAHGHNVLHRDLKPSNVMLAPGGVVKILDFGIARFRPAGTPAAGDEAEQGFLGTPGYVAPEQWVGKPADERSDLYALGVVLFEMITGKRPFPEREPFTLARASIDRIARRASSLRARDVARPRPAGGATARGRSRPSVRREPGLVADELRALLAPPARAGGVRWRRWAAAAIGLVAVAAAVWALNRPVRLDVRNPVIAVLPFDERHRRRRQRLPGGRCGRQPDHEPGLAADRLGAFPGRSRRRARAAHERPATWPAISARPSSSRARCNRPGTQVRLGLNLLRQDGTVAWADAVEGPAERVFEMQARLAGALGSALSVQMSSGGPRAIEHATHVECQRPRRVLAGPGHARAARHAREPAARRRGVRRGVAPRRAVRRCPCGARRDVLGALQRHARHQVGGPGGAGRAGAPCSWRPTTWRPASRSA